MKIRGIVIGSIIGTIMWYLLAVLVFTGCATVRQSAESRLRREYERQRAKWLGSSEAPSAPTEWRSDLARIDARDNTIEFWTRNVKIPAGTERHREEGMNRDGGAEWIIALVHGQGIDRLLIMTMNPQGRARPPSRIWFNGPIYNSLWPMPLMEPAHWRIAAEPGRIAVYLDGREIWHRPGNYTITHAIMNGYHNRGFDGEWAQ